MRLACDAIVVAGYGTVVASPATENWCSSRQETVRGSATVLICTRRATLAAVTAPRCTPVSGARSG